MQLYSDAISINPNNAIYYNNRATCEMQLEEYGAVIADATAALELDHTFIKAFYRRGSALFALGKHKEALADFKQVCLIRPDDPHAAEKLAACRKEHKRLLFEEAIAAAAHEVMSQTVKPETIC